MWLLHVYYYFVNYYQTINNKYYSYNYIIDIKMIDIITRLLLKVIKLLLTNY